MKRLTLCLLTACCSLAWAAPLTPAQQAAAKAAQQRALASLPAGLPPMVGGAAKTVTIGGQQYVTYGELSPQTLSSIAGFAATQAAQPVVVGTTLREAVTVIINETTRVSAVAGALPPELITALSRAALVAPVYLVSGSAHKYTLPRVKQISLPGTPATSMIALKNHVVLLQNGAVRVVKSSAFASSIHLQVSQMYARAGVKQ